MNDYMLLMHDDATDRAIAHDGRRWGDYFAALRESGRFDGGSSIGAGESVRRAGSPLPVASTITGYVRVRALDLEDAKRFLAGNPVYDAGGTIEIRELPKDA